MSIERTPQRIIGDDAYMQLVFEGYEVVKADELSRLREERDKYKTALTLTPMAERLAELPDFMVALSEWGCTEPSEQAASISDFLNSLVGLKQYLEETRP
jgi:hypothetical protein